MNNIHENNYNLSYILYFFFSAKTVNFETLSYLWHSFARQKTREDYVNVLSFMKDTVCREHFIRID